MRISNFSILYLFLSLSLHAQVELHTDLQKIRTQGFDSSRLREYAIHLTDVFGPRLSGTESNYRATEWTASVLRAMG